MLVYAVIVGHNYAGYSEPAGIFSTYKKASEFYDRMDKKAYDSVEIFEYEMNEPWSGFKA